MSEQAEPLVLAIDLGTSYTVAAIRRGARSPEVLEVGGERRMPSTVIVADDGELVVGRAAEDLASARPGDALRAPKRRLGDPSPAVLGGRPFAVVDLVAAMLRAVTDEAAHHGVGAPTSVRLTHPASWTTPRLDQLVRAAGRAGVTDPVLVPEPLAAAVEHGIDTDLPTGTHVAVYDLGGGTFDTTILRVGGDAPVAVGRPGGDASLGGELFDELLVNVVGERLEPGVWDELQASDELSWRRAAAALRMEVRRAKEALTQAPVAELLLPLPAGLVHLRITRDDLDAVVGPYVDESVRVLLDSVRAAGVDVASLGAVYLVGGASRMPLVTRRLTEALGDVPVLRRGDPKAVVALGAARAAFDVARPPVTRPAGPASAPTSPATVVDADATALDRTPVVERPVAAPPAPPARVDTLPPPVPVAPVVPSGRRRTLVGAAVVSAVVIAGGLWAVTSRGGDGDASATTTSATFAAASPGGAPVTAPTVTSAPAVTAAPAAPITLPSSSTTAAAPVETTAVPAATVPVALDQAGLDTVLLTMEEVVRVTGRSDWSQQTFRSDGTPVCGIPEPPPIRSADTRFVRGSGATAVTITAQVFTFADVGQVAAFRDADFRAMRDCPEPSFTSNGTTYAVTPVWFVDRQVPLADLAWAQRWVTAGPSITNESLFYVYARGRSTVSIQYDVAGREIADVDTQATESMLATLAAKLLINASGG